MHVGAPDSGCTSRVVLAKTSLTAAKAEVAVLFQASVLALFFVLAKSEFYGGVPGNPIPLHRRGSCAH